jgi:hypothetical protein
MKSGLAKIIEKTFQFLASIQLAVIIIFSLAVISAVGTIYEARYDATYAQKLIYHSPLMYFILGLLCVNLINVIIDRWPWKRHHLGFILAHVGIIMLVLGSLVTKIYGIDGSLALDIGGKNKFVMLNDTEVAVFATFGNQSYKPIAGTQQDFLLRPPQSYPVEFQLGSRALKIVDYAHYALREQKVVDTGNSQDGPAVRIQLQNANVNLTQWLTRTASVPYESFDLGPAKIILASRGSGYQHSGGNEIVLTPDGAEKLKFDVYTKSKGGRTKSGVIRVADVVDTGWMGLQLRLLKYLPHAEQKIEYQKRDRPTGLTSAALRISFDGREHWIGLNSTIRLFDETTMYLVAFRNRMVDIGFDMTLENFSVGRYQGTNRAMSYESIVEVPGLGSQKISMNEPLKHNGLTFYQASFQEDERGEPTTSILSVNKDPGRAMKYLGSLLMVLGTIFMFWFKHYRLKMFKNNTQESQ